MALIVSDILNSVRAILNDSAIDLYTNDVLLPYIKLANDSLSDELIDAGTQVQKEIASDISVPASITATTPILPDDFIAPIEVFEKLVGEDDSRYTKVIAGYFEPNCLPQSYFGVYAWREQAINLPPCNLNKIIRVRYHRLLTVITTANSPIEVTHAKNYLAYKTASLAAESIGQNQALSDRFNAKAKEYLEKIVSREVKVNQGVTVRRRGFQRRRLGLV